MVPAPSAQDVVRAAARHLHACDRVELGALAAELGTSRVTLHRRVGNREQLMGEALWLLARSTFAMSTTAWDEAAAVGGGGEEAIRSLWVTARFRSLVAADPGMRHLLDEEPALAIRLLTDPRGRVQPRIVALQAQLFQADVDAGVLSPLVDVAVLSYAVVRLAESFLYADVLASLPVDLEACTALIDALVTARRR